MKKIALLFLVVFVSVVTLSAQADKYEQRYELMVSKLGPSGVGVENLLTKWAAADSTDEKLLAATFKFYFAKAQSSQVVARSQKKYLGMKPLFSLKDSTGTDVHYYQETFFDDELYAKALKAADRAIAFHPSSLDFRFMKANAYISYEKESPDMALAYLLELIKDDEKREGPWLFEGKTADSSFFEDAMQEYCYSFYSIGSTVSMDAFLKLSEVMYKLHPANTIFLCNIGSYHMVAKQDYKKALKYYSKVLKKTPGDKTAVRNSLVAARKMKNARLVEKLNKML